MKLSRILSIILHPIFMPLLVVFLSVTSIPALVLMIKPSLPIIYFVVSLSTLVLPLCSLLIKLKLGAVSSIEIKNHKERHHVLFPTFFWMLLGFYFLQPFLIYAKNIETIYLGALLIVFLALIISLKWKISLHLLGIGGATGVFFGLQQLYGEILFLVILFTAFSGLLAFARIDQQAHNNSQVYIGFLLGFILEYGLLIYC